MTAPDDAQAAAGTGDVVHGQVSDVSGGQVAVGGRIFQIDAASGAHVVINAETQAQVVRRPPPVMRPSPPFPGLVGRAGELASIRAALAGGSSVEVVGESGIGKTTLLRAASHAPLGGRTPDGVIAVPAQLGVQESLNYVFDACYQGTRRVVPRWEELVDTLQGLRLLVVLDDPDLPRDDVERLRQVLASSLFLLAAREPRVFGGVEELALGGLSDDEGVELIGAAVGRALSDRERDVAARVTQVLSGTPLELVRFASLVRESDGDLVSVARGFGVDAQPADVLHAVQRSVSAEEAAVLAALAAFDAPVGAGPLAAFASAPHCGELLVSLAQRGLVQGDDLQGWRARVREAAPPEDRQRAAAVLITWVQRRRVAEEVAAEIPAITAVLEASRRDQRWGDVVALAAAAERPLAVAGRWAAWEQTLHAGLSAAHAAGDTVSARFFDHQLTVMADALAGGTRVIASTGGQPRVRVDDTGPSRVVPTPPPPPYEPPPPSWWRRHGGLLAGLVVVLVGVVAVGVWAALGGGEDGATPNPGPVGATESAPPTPSDSGGSSGPVGTPNLVAFTLGDESAQLVVGDEVERTVRVQNQPAEGVGTAEGGTLVVSVQGPALTLLGGEPGCRADSRTQITCQVGALGVGATTDVTVRLRAETAGSATLVTTARDSTNGRERSQSRTFDIADRPPSGCTVPSVVGMPVAQATAELEKAGLAVKPVSVEDGKASGAVLTQSESAGQQVACGTTVTIEFSGLN